MIEPLKAGCSLAEAQQWFASLPSLGAVEVGKVYKVPCAMSLAGTPHTNYYPLLGPMHSDEALGIAGIHMHFDFRFFTDAQLKFLLGGRPELVELPVYPLENALNYGAVYRAQTCYRKKVPIAKSLGQRLIDKHHANSAALRDSERNLRSLKCGRCPHKQYSYQAEDVVAGELHCPLHGFRFNMQTGKPL